MLHSFKGATEDLDHVLKSYDVAYDVCSRFFAEFGLVLAKQKFCREMIEKFLHHPPFREKGKFLWQVGVCVILWRLWGVCYLVVALGREKQ